MGIERFGVAVVTRVESPYPLGEVLNLLRLSETTYYHAALAAPWAFQMPEIPQFHFVSSGRCCLKVDGEETVQLDAGDLLVVPHGKRHRLASDPSARLVDLASVPRREVSRRFSSLKYGDRGARTTLMCGNLSFAHPAAGHLIAYLPRIMHVDAIAHQLGYGSGPAFSKAVKRFYGKWPGALRSSNRTHRLRPLTPAPTMREDESLDRADHIGAVRLPARRRPRRRVT
jgi:AraC-like DNA-binding protein